MSTTHLVNTNLPNNRNSHHFEEYDQDGVEDIFDEDDLAAYSGDSDEDSDYLDEDAESESNIDIPDEIFPASENESDSDAGSVINDDEMEMFHHNLKAAHGFKKGQKRAPNQQNGNRGGGRRSVGDKILSYEVKNLMGEANQAFAAGDLDHAMVLVKKVIQIEAGVYSAWKILGEIFKEKGEFHKCLLAWLTAAHAKPKDWELWLTCARMSLDQYGEDKQNYRDQALYCYNRAIRGNSDNIDAIYDRSLLYKETGQLKKASEGFIALNRLLPNDMAILREIAGLYTELNKIPEAIEYYMCSLTHFRTTGNSDKVFGWSELNILVELYMMLHQWNEAIKTVGNVGRWLYGRAEESYWDELDDDREWDSTDERRLAIPEFVTTRFDPETYALPLELRVKLGVCRIKQKNKTEAMVHFEYLNEVDPIEYFDLFQEAGNALYDARAFEEAIRFYSSVVEVNECLDRKLWFNMAGCYKALNRVEDAEDCYGTVLEENPQDTEAMMELASIYEVSNRRAEALDLVNEVIELRKARDAAEKFTSESLPTAWSDSMAFVPNRPATRKTRKRRPGVLTAEQRAEMNARKTEKTAIKYRKLEYLKAGMEAGEAEAVKDWLDTAGELVDDFRNTKALFPAERGKAFKGFVSLAQRRAKAKGDKEQLERMQHRLEESLTIEDDQLDSPADDMTKFRGLNSDAWLYIFMQYALCLAKHDDYQDAYDVCSVAKEANIFYLDKHKLFIIWTTWLSCAIWVHDSESCSTISRWFMTTFQFQTEVYTLFVAALNMSRNGLETFHNNANQKFLLRQIKIMDESVDGKKRANAASLTNLDDNGNDFKPTNLDVGLLMLYGHILASGKSYLSAMNYYARVYAITPNNPMVLLSISTAYLHRCMQRQSENRQMQALQAMTFLFEYYESRTNTQLPPSLAVDDDSLIEKELYADQLRQEAEFNVARSFHQLGLGHLSIDYYLRCLNISDRWKEKGRELKSDIRWEAAYNLQMIYITSGNAQAAMNITERSLVI